MRSFSNEENRTTYFIRDKNNSQVVGFFCFFMAILLTGCSYTGIIDRTDSKNDQKYFSIKQFNQEITGKSLTIKLRNSHTYQADNINVSIDSTSFKTENTYIEISNDSILYFKWMNHLGGAGEGFLFSVVPAVLLTQEFEFNDAHVRIMNILPASIMVGVVTIGYGLAGKPYYYEFLSETVKYSNNRLTR